MKDIQMIEKLQEKLGYKFKDISLLKLALTHKSYAYEYTGIQTKEYNERIEFLGDAILEHIISDELYNSKEQFAEGEMTKKRAAIVCEASLSQAMKRINGQEYIYLGKCEKITNGRKKDAIIADAFEAVLGAIYIDGGYDIARKVCLSLLKEEINIVLSGKSLNTDYKTKLQEILQVNGNVDIHYETISDFGPEHDKTFKVELTCNNKKIGEGIGKSKKQAEQQAAKNALENGKYD